MYDIRPEPDRGSGAGEGACPTKSKRRPPHGVSSSRLVIASLFSFGLGGSDGLGGSRAGFRSSRLRLRGSGTALSRPPDQIGGLDFEVHHEGRLRERFRRAGEFEFLARFHLARQSLFELQGGV